jgi:hypothetical protein
MVALRDQDALLQQPFSQLLVARHHNFLRLPTDGPLEHQEATRPIFSRGLRELGFEMQALTAILVRC